MAQLVQILILTQDQKGERVVPGDSMFQGLLWKQILGKKKAVRTVPSSIRETMLRKSCFFRCRSIFGVCMEMLLKV